MKEVLIALLLCILNFASGIIVYNISIKKENKTFNKIFFSSVAFRFVINLFLLWIILNYLRFEPFKFSLTYFVGTFIFILLEAIYLNFKQKFVILKNIQDEK